MASKKIFLPLVLGALLALFIGLTIFGDNGLLHLAGMNQEIHRIENNIRKLERKYLFLNSCFLPFFSGPQTDAKNLDIWFPGTLEFSA
ncbi:MAG: hypothetical protein BZ151_12290 [Desulfobacca sp. 4484_104]|nr:MAG: hypothetical protein BZ151_12290 [Desulfobacca sp. 4484_104]